MKSKQKVCLYGAGGHAKVIKDLLEVLRIGVSQQFDDNTNLVSASDSYQPGIGIAGQGKFSPPDHPFVIAIGKNRVRQALVEQLDRLEVGYFQPVHTTSVISETAVIGMGTVVFANAVVQVDAVIGQHVIINSSTVVEHDCRVGDFVHVAPNSTLCGNVCVGEGTHIGAGATVIENIKIGKWCVIGAGAVVTGDVPDGTIAVGCPAKPIRVNNG